MSIKPDYHGIIRFAGIALTGLSLASIAGCEEEPSAESAGEAIDRGIDDAGDAINDGMDDASDALDDAADDIDDMNDPVVPPPPAP